MTSAGGQYCLGRGRNLGAAGTLGAMSRDVAGTNWKGSAPGGQLEVSARPTAWSPGQRQLRSFSRAGRLGVKVLGKTAC